MTTTRSPTFTFPGWATLTTSPAASWPEYSLPVSQPLYSVHNGTACTFTCTQSSFRLRYGGIQQHRLLHACNYGSFHCFHLKISSSFMAIIHCISIPYLCVAKPLQRYLRPQRIPTQVCTPCPLSSHEWPDRAQTSHIGQRDWRRTSSQSRMTRWPACLVFPDQVAKALC